MPMTIYPAGLTFSQRQELVRGKAPKSAGAKRYDTPRIQDFGGDRGFVLSLANGYSFPAATQLRAALSGIADFTLGELQDIVGIPGYILQLFYYGMNQCDPLIRPTGRTRDRGGFDSAVYELVPIEERRFFSQYLEPSYGG